MTIAIRGLLVTAAEAGRLFRTDTGQYVGTYFQRVKNYYKLYRYFGIKAPIFCDQTSNSLPEPSQFLFNQFLPKLAF